MKTLLSALFIAISILLSFTAGAQLNCTTEIAPDVFVVDGAAISPGDVICLLAGNKDYLLFKDIQGTESQPVTIINKGGTVVINTDHFYGIKFDNCKHVIFSGSGYEGQTYGIQVKRVGQGAGMSVDNMSTNIEINNIEIAFTAIAGIYAKTEPYQGDCNNLITRDKFTMYNLIIHDCYLHDIADEGMYIGSSKYTGQTIYQCNDIVVLPHVIEGVEVYNNIVENTGWDGIQVSSSPVDCSIHNNTISYDSYAEEYGQMSGILIGSGTRGECYSNSISDGKGDGIDVLGLGFMKVFNNLIVRAGRTYKPNEPNEYKHGIFVGQVVTDQGATFKLYNNTIVSPKTSGIKYANNEAAMGYISNNLITDPGGVTSNGNPSYIEIVVDEQKVDVSYNFDVPANSTVKFVDYADNNFDLKPNSEAVNFGKSLTNEGITFDIINRFRPFHTYFDAGAYECHDPTAAVVENNIVVGNLYPIPATNYLNIPINLDANATVNVIIASISGNVVFKRNYAESQIVNQKLTLNIVNLKTGKYIISININGRWISRPVIIVN